MKYEINGVEYSQKQLENILSGLTAKYCDEQGNPIQGLQDSALIIMEGIDEGRSFTPLTFDEAMNQSRLLHTEEE
jgi:hypothetical protein